MSKVTIEVDGQAPITVDAVGFVAGVIYLMCYDAHQLSNRAVEYIATRLNELGIQTVWVDCQPGSIQAIKIVAPQTIAATRE